MFKIDIPSPCGESLADMTPTARGLYCAACSREILDFTKFTDEQLYKYFISASENGRTPCGFFRPDQLDHNLAPLPRPSYMANTWRALGLLMAGLAGVDSLNAQQIREQEPVTSPAKDSIPDWAERPRYVAGVVKDAAAGVPVSYCRVTVQGDGYYHANTEEDGTFKIELPAGEEGAALKVTAHAIGYQDFNTMIANPQAVLPVNMTIRMEAGVEIVAHGLQFNRMVTGLVTVSQTVKLNRWQRLKYFFIRKKDQIFGR